jgi:hypothetical protein
MVRAVERGEVVSGLRRARGNATVQPTENGVHEQPHAEKASPERLVTVVHRRLLDFLRLVEGLNGAQNRSLEVHVDIYNLYREPGVSSLSRNLEFDRAPPSHFVPSSSRLALVRRRRLSSLLKYVQNRREDSPSCTFS